MDDHNYWSYWSDTGDFVLMLRGIRLVGAVDNASAGLEQPDQKTIEDALNIAVANSQFADTTPSED